MLDFSLSHDESEKEQKNKIVIFDKILNYFYIFGIEIYFCNLSMRY